MASRLVYIQEKAGSIPALCIRDTSASGGIGGLEPSGRSSILRFPIICLYRSSVRIFACQANEMGSIPIAGVRWYISMAEKATYIRPIGVRFSLPPFWKYS